MNIDNLNELNYVFNLNKLSETEAKTLMKNFLVSKSDDLFSQSSGIGLSKMNQLFKFNGEPTFDATRFKVLMQDSDFINN